MYSGRRFLDSSQIRSNRGLKRYVNFWFLTFLYLNALKPSSVTGKHFGALDFPDHQAVSRHQPQCRFKLGDSADQDWLRPARPILLERNIENDPR
jgi:hypothetical protein